MNSKTVRDRQHAIESHSARGANVHLSRLISRWHQIWQSLTHHLFRSNEPQVWQLRDSSGNVRWQAYDPVSRQRLVCSTEQEVRIWLEQLHYQQSN